jgi:hypothetical protein
MFTIGSGPETDQHRRKNSMHAVSAPAHANTQTAALSPLMLSHQLLSLAEEAHRAGLPRSASRLLRLAHSVCSDRSARD